MGRLNKGISGLETKPEIFLILGSNASCQKAKMNEVDSPQNGKSDIIVHINNLHGCWICLISWQFLCDLHMKDSEFPM